MIVKTIQNSYELEHEFVKMGRGEHFSAAGYEILFDILEEYAEGTETPLELDVIALCCEFDEFTQEALESDYGLNFEDLKERDIYHKLGTYANGTVFAIVNTHEL